MFTTASYSTNLDGNFLLLRPYHGEHGPKVPVTPEYIVLQRVLRLDNPSYTPMRGPRSRLVRQRA
jgi:hypothetical protein